MGEKYINLVEALKTLWSGINRGCRLASHRHTHISNYDGVEARS